MHEHIGGENIGIFGRQLPNTIQCFADQEVGRKGYWRHPSESYEKIKKHRMQYELAFDDFSACDAGYCGL